MSIGRPRIDGHIGPGRPTNDRHHQLVVTGPVSLLESQEPVSPTRDHVRFGNGEAPDRYQQPHGHQHGTPQRPFLEHITNVELPAGLDHIPERPVEHRPTQRSQLVIVEISHFDSGDHPVVEFGKTAFQDKGQSSGPEPACPTQPDPADGRDDRPADH